MRLVIEDGKIEFGGETLIEHINFDISNNDKVAIIGKNGCGKTTLMNLIGGLEKPTSGVIKIAGEDITNFSRANTAKFRAEKCGAKLVLGSATPSLESYYNAINGEYNLIDFHILMI